MTEPKVLISILNWNNGYGTIETVNSVLQSEYKNYEIIILDNNSIDDSYHKIKITFPEIFTLRLNNNLGFAGAHKKAASFAIENKFELLWILNNDVQVFPFTLSELVLAYNRNSVALIGSVSLEPDGQTIHFGGGAELTINYTINEKIKYNHFSGKNYFAIQMNERPVSDIEGASFVIPVLVIKQYGFLNTRFFLYGEETDYCYKLRNEFKIQSIIVPKARIIHKASSSFELSPRLAFIRHYYFTRNIHLIYKKNFKNYKIQGNGGMLHLLKFFFMHYLFVKQENKNYEYWVKYYTKLGYLHSLLRLRGKYLEPNNFMK